jgi:hypothetical protein
MPEDQPPTEQATNAGAPAESGGNRAPDGKFLRGHAIGEATRFEPGNSRSPGRGKGVKSMASLLRKLGAEDCPETLQQTMSKLFNVGQRKLTMLEAALRATYIRAIQGESWAMKFIADRTEGRVPLSLDARPLEDRVVRMPFGLPPAKDHKQENNDAGADQRKPDTGESAAGADAGEHPAA